MRPFNIFVCGFCSAAAISFAVEGRALPVLAMAVFAALNGAFGFGLQGIRRA